MPGFRIQIINTFSLTTLVSKFNFLTSGQILDVFNTSSYPSPTKNSLYYSTDQMLSNMKIFFITASNLTVAIQQQHVCVCVRVCICAHEFFCMESLQTPFNQRRSLLSQITYECYILYIPFFSYVSAIFSAFTLPVEAFLIPYRSTLYPSNPVSGQLVTGIISLLTLKLSKTY